MVRIKWLLAVLLTGVTMWLGIGVARGENQPTPGEVTVLKLTDFGARPNDAMDDSAAWQKALDAMQKHSGATLSVAPGVYRIERHRSPVDKHQMLTGANLSHITIEGENAQLLFGDPACGGISFRHCENLTVRGLTWDWDPLPFTQGVIEKVEDDGRRVTVRIDPGFADPVGPAYENANLWSTVHDRYSGLLISGSGHNDVKPWQSIKRIGPRQFVLILKDCVAPDGIAAGRRLTLNARYGGAMALRLTQCHGVTLEDLTFWSSPSMTVITSNCSGPLVYRHIVIEPKPGSARLQSSDADGLHFISNEQGPLIENCRLSRLQDDGIIIATRGNQVIGRVNANTLRIRRASAAFNRVGDVLEAISTQGVRRGPTPPIESITPFHERDQSGVELRLAGPVPNAQVGDWVFNQTLSNTGFVIRDNVIRNIRARPIKLHGSHGLVEDNIIDGCNGAAVIIKCKLTDRIFSTYRWGDHITIRGNHITRDYLHGLAWGTLGAIEVSTKLPSDARQLGRPHRHLVIEHNTIRWGGRMGIDINDADDVTISNNLISQPNQLLSIYLAQHQQSAADTRAYAIRLANVRHVRVTDNIAQGAKPSLQHLLEIMPHCQDVTATDNKLILDGQLVSEATSKKVSKN